MLSVDYMKMIDRVLLKHLRENAVNQEIHVIYRQVANDLMCSQPTVYRSVTRLRASGYLKPIAGSDSVGYTYQINLTE